MSELFPKELLDKGYETPDGSFAWQYSDLPEVLQTIVSGNKAILGGGMSAIVNGRSLNPFTMVDEDFEFPMWSTKPQNTDEDWTSYCRRTFEESLSELDSLKLDEIIQHNEHILFRPVYAGSGDPLLLVPRDKHDHARAEAAIAAGYPAVEPVLPQLLEWLQDMNWPVAQTLATFLAGIGPPLIPHVKKIFETDDEIWKYWVIREILTESQPLTEALQTELKRIASSPTKSELEEELDVEAREVLELHRLN